jgi:DNA-binding transcriptional LysR family regulator
MLQDDTDLAIRFGVPPDSSFVARPLAQNRRVLCASPRYLAKCGAPEHPRDLERFDCIVLGTTAGPANDWRFTRKGKVERFVVPLANARETNDGAVAREWAIHGYGIALKSIWDIGADLRSGRLAIVLPEWRSAEAPVHALYQRNRYMAPRVRALLDFLIARFAEVSCDLDFAYCHDLLCGKPAAGATRRAPALKGRFRVANPVTGRRASPPA